MLKYLLIIAINVPIIVFGLSRVYKIFRKGSLSTSELVLWSSLWITLFMVLILALPFEELALGWLYPDLPTEVDSPNIFDAIEVTFLSILLYLLYRQGAKINYLEAKLAQVGRAIALKDSEEDR